MSNSSTTYSGVTFSGALFLVFLVSKLTGVISWSWWWVTSPLWINALIVLLIIVIWVWVVPAFFKWLQRRK